MNPQEHRDIESAANSFWGFFVTNWRVTILTILILIIGGFGSLLSLPLESDPEVKIPIAVVSTVYPGASPADIEKLVTDRIEEKLKNLENLDKLTSSSSEGVSSVTVEFDASANLTESLRNLRDEVDNIKADLPEDANDPMVIEISVSDNPIVTVSLLANLPPAEMKIYGEDLQDILEGVSGVSEVLLSGLENEEMQVLVNIQKLEGFGISLNSVVNAIAANHIDFPIGSIRTNEFYYQASLKAQFDTAEELLALPIASRSNQNIYLRDVATVREAFAATTTDARVYQPSEKAYYDSITLQVKKKTGANITNTVDRVKTAVEAYQKKTLPPQAEVLITNDWSKYVKDDINTLGTSGIQTVLIIFVVLFIALGVKEALMVGLTIPLIFLLTFIGLSLAGETINSLVLFALVLSLGLLVDTSIVMMEGIHEAVKQKGLSGREAALLAINTYKTPLISGTLTTVAVFIPMMMMTGIMGEYIKHIPITIAITLFSSLFVAIMILSAIAARVFRSYHATDKKDKEPILNKILVPIRVKYLRQLEALFSSKRKRVTLILSLVVTFLVAMTFPFVGILKVEMFPSVDFDFFSVDIKLPTGATLQETAKVVESVEKMVEDLPELTNFVTILGSASSLNPLGGGGSSGGNRAQITVNLTDMNTRNIKSYVLADQIRAKVNQITEAEVTVQELDAGPPSGAPIEVRVLGDDVNKLEAFSIIVMQELAQIPGTRDITNDAEHGTGEFHFTLKRDRLNYYGVTAAGVAADLRAAVFGNNSVKILRNGKETPVVVSLDFRNEVCKNDKNTQLLELRDKVTICRNNPENISQIKNLMLTTPRGLVPVSELADVEIFPAITTIRHRDTATVVNVKSYTKDDALPTEITAELQKRIAENVATPEGIRLDFGGETEDITESFQSLFNAMIIGVFLIVLILVLQFNSFRQPLIIMFTLPLALIGVFFGLALMGRNFSFPGFIGIVALCGVVVNDAIVLIDGINQNIRKFKMEPKAAIIKAGGDRLQPVILTTVTTVAGVIPLAFANEMWGDLAWTIAFGITFATILTLFMVPILYAALENKKELAEMRVEESEEMEN
jgi:multidrug efflux pump subunit AcrB